MSERIWEDAWVENGRLLVRFKDGNTIEIALIDDLVRKHQEDDEKARGARADRLQEPPGPGYSEGQDDDMPF